MILEIRIGKDGSAAWLRSGYTRLMVVRDMFSEEIREDIERYIILHYRPEGAKEPIYALELRECQLKNGTIVREIIKELSEV